MRRVETGHPDRREYLVESENKLSFVYIIIAVVAVTVIGNVFKDPSNKPYRVGIEMLAIPVCILIIVKRTWLMIDRAQRILTRRTTVFGIPFGTTKLDLRSIFFVHARAQLVTPSKRPDYVLYTVAMNNGKFDVLDLMDTKSETAARAGAADIAEFLNIPLKDSVVGNPVIIPPASMRPLVERSEILPPAADIAAPPPGMLSMTQADGDRVLVTLPADLNRYVASPVGLAIILFLAALFCLPALGTVLRGQYEGLFFVAIGCGIAAWPVVDIIRCRKSVEILATRLQFRVTVRTPVSGSVDEILSSEIQDIRVESGRLDAAASAPFFRAATPGQDERLAVISPSKIIRFGDGLARHELEWLRAVLLKAVTSK
jgi:hypothetical protein